MKAIVDCNSFYCSCERVFRPELESKPVVVLSNNDGCIISRTDEAKHAGVGMAGPYHLALPLIQQHQMTVFSSNYNLYGDMSWRVMETLKETFGPEQVEVYSVDEAFVDLNGFSDQELQQVGVQIKRKIECWTGVKVSVGIAPTKTLAKIANIISKKNKGEGAGVTVLADGKWITDALKRTPVHAVWGIGRKLAGKLTSIGIATAWDLQGLSEDWARRHLGGITGLRLVKELKGEEAIFLASELTVKKSIATTRMFGVPVTDVTDIKEAVATYTARAAEKLRRQRSAATVIGAFVVPKNGDETQDGSDQPSTLSLSTVLPLPTSLTNDLIKPAVRMAEQLFRSGAQYSKAGVVLSGLVPDDSIQGNLFAEEKSMGRLLMEMVDNINFSMRGDLVKFAATGTRRNWKMRQAFHSPRYTTRWEELCTVR